VGREIILYVSKLSGVAHHSMECEYLLRVPDEHIRIAHAQTSSLPRLLFCSRCFPPTIPDDPSEEVWESRFEQLHGEGLRLGL